MNRLHRNICKECGNYFISKSNSKQFCSSKCKGINREKGKQTNDQLCWQCQKATGGCPWSDNFKPVEGWVAKPTIIKDSARDIKTYKIKKCPLFIRG